MIQQVHLWRTGAIAGSPEEVAPAYVYLAASDLAYVAGQGIHINGGEIVNG